VVLVTLLQAVQRDVEALNEPDRSSGVAALALELAGLMGRRPSAMVAKELRDTLVLVRELTPARVEGDSLDDLRDRRAQRRGA
jgi:hypothetical protein